jgi:hypothetical protein
LAMKSNSDSEAIPAQISDGKAFLLIFACVIVFSFASAPAGAGPAVSIPEMARIEAVDSISHDDTLYLYRGYLSLGLVPEAASFLERRVRMGTFPQAAAEGPFEALVEAQSRFDSPESLVTVCEAAMRSGVRTPGILYHYGTGLRRVPGRTGDASSILSQVGPGSPYHLPSLYVLGQIAAERGDPTAAETLFRRIEREAGESGNSRLARRAARSRAEMLLAAGRGAEATPMFHALAREEGGPLDRIGFAAGGKDPVADLERMPAEVIAALPLKERVGFLLLHGGLARQSGRHELAMERLTRAEKELKDAISSPSPRHIEPPDRFGIVESLRIQVGRLRSLREGMATVSRSRKKKPAQTRWNC